VATWRHTAGAAGLLARVVAAALSDVLLGGRTLSPAAWVPGVLPSGSVGAPAPPPPVLRDLEGAAWVGEPAPYLVHRPLAQGRLPLWNAGAGLGALDAVQIHGGSGYMAELPLGKLARDAKMFEIGGGTNEIQLQTIARALLA
jgi:hypothetical protein